MRKHLLLATLGLLSVSTIRADGPVAGKPCGEAAWAAGTCVNFEKTPSAAARKALQEEKLVMILHVSGDFEDPEFT